jgi:hypothetical protein
VLARRPLQGTFNQLVVMSTVSPAGSHERCFHQLGMVVEADVCQHTVISSLQLACEVCVGGGGGGGGGVSFTYSELTFPCMLLKDLPALTTKRAAANSLHPLSY